MHRSGTSLAAAMLCMAGAAPPAHLMLATDENETGYWEAWPLYRLNEDLLMDLGLTWDSTLSLPPELLRSAVAQRYIPRYVEVLREEYGDAPLFCAKDPRNSRLLPALLLALDEVAADPKYVIITRHPLEVADSLKERGFYWGKSLMLWLRHTLEAEQHTRGQRRVFITYDQLLNDWRGVLRRIGDALDIAWPRRIAEADAEFERIISNRLRHHRADADALNVRGDITEWVAALYDAAIAASEDRMEEALPVFDRVRESLAVADAAFEPILADAVRSERNLKDVERELSERLNEREGELDTVRAQRDVARENAGALSAVVQERDGELGARHAELEAAHAALGTAHAELETARAELEAVRTDNNAHAAQVQERDEQLGGQRAELEAARAELDAARDQVEKLSASLAPGTEDLRAKTEALTSSLQQRNAELTGMKAQLDAARSELLANANLAAEQQTHAEALAAQLDERGRELEAVQRRSANAAARAANRQAQIERFFSELEARDDEVRRMRAETKKLGAAIAAADLENRTRNSELEKSRAQQAVEKAGYETRLARAATREQELEETLRVAQKAAEGREALLGETRALLNVSEAKVAELSAKASRTQTQIALLKEELSQGDEGAVNLQELNALQSRLQVRDAEAAQLETHVAVGRETLDSALDDLERLKVDLAVSQAESAELRMKVLDLEMRLAGQSRRLPGSQFAPLTVKQLSPADVLTVDNRERDLRSGLCNILEWRGDLAPRSDAVSRPHGSIGVFIHIYYDELAAEIAAVLKNIPYDFRAYVSTADQRRADAIAEAFRSEGIADFVVRVLPNVGRDIGPFLTGFRDEIRRHDICLRLHSKKSTHNVESFGTSWRRHIFACLLSDRARVRRIVGTFVDNDKIGIVIPEHWDEIRSAVEIGQNWHQLRRLLNRMDVSIDPASPIEFPSGSMFWFRSAALEPLLSLSLTAGDFAESAEQHRDFTIAHAIERAFLFSSAKAGFLWASVSPSVAFAVDDDLEAKFVSDLDRESEQVKVAPEQQQPARDWPADRPDVCIGIDEPRLERGAAVDPVRAMLTIAGWAVAQDGLDRVEVQLDDGPPVTAFVGAKREDIAGIFPTCEEALFSGFGVAISQRLIGSGEHIVHVRAVSKLGGTAVTSFTIVAEEVDDSADAIRSWLPQVEIDQRCGFLRQLGHEPHFAIWVRAADLSKKGIEALRATLRSLQSQAYTNWDACVAFPSAVDGTAIDLAGPLLEREFADRVRICVAGSAARNGPSHDFVVMLNAGDRLGADALLEFATESALVTETEFIYGDERCFDPSSEKLQKWLKPDWSPDLLLSMNYVGRGWCASTGLIERVGLELDHLASVSDYDAALRLTEKASRVAHVPVVLCERSVAHPDSSGAQRAALEAAVARRGIAATVQPGRATDTWRVKRRIVAPGLVSIIMPTCAPRGLVEIAINSIRNKTSYKDYEIVCIDDIPEERKEWKPWIREHADRVIPAPGKYNWSLFNNAGVAASRGEYLLFMNDDIEVLEPEWIQALLEHAQRSEVGIVGTQLLYPDGKVQHGGIFIAGGGFHGRHSFRFAPGDEPGQFGMALAQRDAFAVTGACVLVRRSVYDDVGGFDESHDVVNNDVDFCLRVRKKGYNIVYTPFTALTHHELAGRGKLPESYDESKFRDDWAAVVAKGDPYFNPGLAQDIDEYLPDMEPVEAVYCGHPIIARSNVKRIVVLKLDHIGDFLTSLPAFRRIRERFPDAEITALIAGPSVPFASTEPAIDRCIEFNFFSKRSGEGAREIGAGELERLSEELGSSNFDLAIDLRVQLDTRYILKHTGARVLAGYDYRGSFPWLQIGLEWDGDEKSRTHRSHISDQMSSLVDAVSLACEEQRSSIGVVSVEEARRKLMQMPSVRRVPEAFFDKPIVCMHPGVGATIRQWPPERYAALINLLVAEEDVNVILIGAPEEVPVAQKVLKGVAYPASVLSLVGQVPLPDLQFVLRSSALFVGNNSGPKHLAGMLGVPTVGVHSANCDTTQWGPLGPNAVAIHRKVHCANCDLSQPEDCHRALACLTGILPRHVYRMCRPLLRIGKLSSELTEGRPA